MLTSFTMGSITVREAAGYVRVYDSKHPEGRPIAYITAEDLHDMFTEMYNLGARNTKNSIYNILTGAEYY